MDLHAKFQPSNFKTEGGDSRDRISKHPPSLRFGPSGEIIIWCITDSRKVNARSTSLSESCHRSLWTMRITVTLVVGALLIFLQSGAEKLLAWVFGDLNPQP